MKKIIIAATILSTLTVACAIPLSANAVTGDTVGSLTSGKSYRYCHPVKTNADEQARILDAIKKIQNQEDAITAAVYAHKDITQLQVKLQDLNNQYSQLLGKYDDCSVVKG